MSSRKSAPQPHRRLPAAKELNPMSKISDLIAAEAANAEEAEATSDPTAPLPDNVRVTRGHNRDKTLQVRLNGDEFEALELFAKANELPLSTVARSLILAGVSPMDDASAAITRMEADLASLRRTVKQL